MLIFSWNVAGLSTTVNRIHDNYYNSVVIKGDKKLKTLALYNFFHRHGADIVCLQEHKIPKQRLVNRSEPRVVSTAATELRKPSINTTTSNGTTTACSTITTKTAETETTDNKDYESFWACCVDEAKKGLNGVVTYARSGTVVSAHAAPLGVPELDKQGRCIMTNHGTFMLFNVYVPCSGGQPLSYKMKFLNALRASMQAQRVSTGLPVILVGDLNITLDRNDLYWKDRVVHVDDVLEEVATVHAGAADNNNNVVPSWKMDLAQNWATIVDALATKEVISTVTSNSMTGGTYNKFRLAVTLQPGNRRVFLGSHESSPEYCLYQYSMDGYSYLDDETGEYIPAQERNAVGVAVLAELMAKICNVPWSDDIVRQIANETASVDRLSPPRRWLRTMLQEDGMIDAFRYFYPTAEARFTCWNQNKNRRYVNDGSRIDYTIIDQSLLPYLEQGSPTLRCGGSCDGSNSSSGTVQDGGTTLGLTELDALRAATANGRFQPVSYEGGGIVEATRDALESQFGVPHTGHVYTPPSFSDHIGVSLLLKDSILPDRNLSLQRLDTTTRQAQPHKAQQSVAAFFRADPSSVVPPNNSNKKKHRVPVVKNNNNTKSSPGNKRAKTSTGGRNSDPPPYSVLHHFRKNVTNDKPNT